MKLHCPAIYKELNKDLYFWNVCHHTKLQNDATAPTLQGHIAILLVLFTAKVKPTSRKGLQWHDALSCVPSLGLIYRSWVYSDLIAFHEEKCQLWYLMWYCYNNNLADMWGHVWHVFDSTEHMTYQQAFIFAVSILNQKGLKQRWCSLLSFWAMTMTVSNSDNTLYKWYKKDKLTLEVIFYMLLNYWYENPIIFLICVN